MGKEAGSGVSTSVPSPAPLLGSSEVWVKLHPYLCFFICETGIINHGPCPTELLGSGTEAHAHRPCAGDELCNRAEVAVGPATQPGLEEQPQARIGFPGKPPRALVSTRSLAAPCRRGLPPDPRLQSTRGTAGSAAANSGAGLRDGFCRLSASALLAGALGTRGISVQALGPFKMAPK